MTVDRDAILQNVDVLALVEHNLGAPAKRSGRWLFFRCPFHAGGRERTPSLGVTPDNGKWKCFGCGAGGNVIDWVMQHDHVVFLEACRRLGASDLPKPSGRIQPLRLAISHQRPPEVWQDQALDLVHDCQALLWQDVGKRARTYLYKRGFTDDTLWLWRLGFQPEKKRYEQLESWGITPPDDGRRHAMWIPRGITIPCFSENGETLRYVKVCRGHADRWGKYVKLPVPNGYSGVGLYGVDWLCQHQTLFLDEGEFNALTIWQEANDLVDVVSTGTASVWPETLRPWWGHFLMAHHILVRFDPDQAGARGTEQWRALSRRIHSVQVPAGDDPNEFLMKHEGNVRAWIEFELAKLGG